MEIKEHKIVTSENICLNKVIYSQEYCDNLPKFSKGLSCLGWAYNEEENIGDYIENAIKLLEKVTDDYELIIVNDGSVDRTKDIVLEYSQCNLKIILVDNPGNQGVAYACSNAIKHASKEYLLWQTVDWSYDISKLRGFLDYMQLCDADVIAGVRRSPVKAVNHLHRLIAGVIKIFSIKHITKRSDTIGKALVSLINYLLIRLLFGVQLSDYQNVCIYRSKLAQGINVESSSSFINPELLFKSYWNGARICEVPISFIPRKKGDAKGTKLASIIRSVCDVFYYFFKFKICDKIINHSGNIIRLNDSMWEIKDE